MSKRIRLSLLPWVLACTVVFNAQAEDLSSRRQEFRSLLEHVEQGAAVNPAAWRKQQDHPLFAYLEYAQLRRHLARAKSAEVERFLRRYEAVPISQQLRQEWLAVLAKQERWAEFAQAYQASSSETLRCQAARAWLQHSASADKGLREAESLWLSGRSVSDACNPAFAKLAVAGRITPALRWQRFGLALDAGNPGIARFAARGLPEAERSTALSLADWLQEPGKGVQLGKPHPQRADMAARVLARIAQRDPDLAETQLAAVQQAESLSADQVGAVRYQIALWSAASYLPHSARRMAAVSDAYFDARLREWQAREALARQDWPAVEAALQKMQQAQREDSRWAYLAARMAEIGGRQDEARAAFQALAQQANFHGFMAADRINAEYALCPMEAPDQATLRRQVLEVPGVQRALELFQLGHRHWASREWAAATPALSDDERRAAVAMALDIGWTDRAVFGIEPAKDSQFYRLRFPIAHSRELNREAKRHQLDPAWVAGLIRAESAWQHDARSHANARGLMQLLPSTAAPLAGQLGIGWRSASTLYDPISNIKLGTAHLANELAQFNGQAFLATAAYNAGPSPVNRWMQQRDTDPVDLWIETIPYKETREYVARVMAFAVIYDWRLGRDPVPLSARLKGDASSTARRSFQCPHSSTSLAQQP
ncbi:lytic transglycosylase domain-containing protein [Pseudomarimonas arenosa]|uniref:Lytic transglycosylase domain-containing protein n=1 Tax=Pseudomarimonas arenosa TaxID=2774145 RepID=A0AAW3ZIU1_9GAMM|nr:lytic transglycosylase domain-containing protein [Pseudomarimonas arenosa]MBD8525698.1 lytic transglycosylase domain-containing protein [Pseudomarimonas arenosa]